MGSQRVRHDWETKHSTAQTTVNGNAKTLSSQRNFEKEKLSWRNQAPWLETILQSHGNQDSIVLAQKQTCRSWNKTESPKRNLCNYGHLIFWQRGKEYTKKTKPSHFIKWCWSKNSVVVLSSRKKGHPPDFFPMQIAARDKHSLYMWANIFYHFPLFTGQPVCVGDTGEFPEKFITATHSGFLSQYN